MKNAWPTVTEAANRAYVSRGAIHRAVAKRDLHHVRVSGRGAGGGGTMTAHTALSPQDPAAMQAPRGRFHLHSVDELLELPSPHWLIDRVLEAGILAVLYGASGSGKTFIALDWALSIAAGTPWLGHTTRQGPVVYVAAEGGRSVQKRVRAWLIRKGTHAIPDGYFVLEPVQVRDSTDLDALRRQFESRNVRPALIVFDTFARCFVGGEENSAKEVGEFIEACRRFEDAGTAVLIVHHTGKAGDTERGSSALRAASDMMAEVSRTAAGALRISNTKQKDAEAFDDIGVRLEEIAVGRDDVTGRELTSCVVTAAEEVTTPTQRLSANAMRALLVLQRHPDGSAASGVWRQATEQPERTFHRSREALIAAGLVRELADRSGWYEAITQPPRDAPPGGQLTAAATATTP